MSRTFPTLPEISPPTHTQFNDDIRAAGKPVLMRGLVRDWHAVKAASEGDKAAFEYLRGLDRGRPQATLIGQSRSDKRFFYSDDFRRQNYDRYEQSVSAALNDLESKADDGLARFIQSIPLPDYLPDFASQNPMPLLGADVVPRAWIGNETIVQTHFDLSENIACCVIGARRVTLFPPEQLPNLYLGPLETSPGGAYVSLTNLHTPDFDAHPRFKDALGHAVQVELSPGDALYIPCGWWHHVHAHAPLNMLVNYWWKAPQSARTLEPLPVLLHSLMAFKNMPANERKIWQNIFASFIFEEHDDPMAHLPPEQRGILGGIPESHRVASIYELLGVLGREVGLSPPAPPQRNTS